MLIVNFKDVGQVFLQYLVILHGEYGEVINEVPVHNEQSDLVFW